MDYLIRHVACAVGSADLFATAASEHEVTIWSYARRSQLAGFTTVLDSGGRRLAVLPGSPPIVIAGAYNTYGVVAYDGLSGQVLWRRKDLKNPQYVTGINMTNPGPLVGVGFDAHPYVLLDASSGNTVRELRAVRHVFVDVGGSLALTVRKGLVSLRELPDWDEVWRQPFKSFAVLDAAIASHGVVISEVAGPVSCFDLTGLPLWKWTPEPGSHAVRVSANVATNGWLALVFPYLRGDPLTLVALNADGEPTNQIPLQSFFGAEFLAIGRFLVTLVGSVLDTATGEVVWRFGTHASAERASS